MRQGTRLNRMAVGIPGALFCMLFLVVVCAMGCIHQEPHNDSRLNVAVTVLPQAEIAREIGGENVCVTVVVPPGVEPHTYEPATSQLLELSRSDMYLRIGPGLLPFEDNLLERVRELNPKIQIVDTSAGVPLIHGDDPRAGDDNVDPDHHGTDPHIWLAPSNLRIMAANIEAGLSMADPSHREEYARGKESYLAKVDTTDAAIKAMFSEMDGRSFIVFHPAWGYFAREYNLDQVAVEDGGTEPGIRHLTTLVEFAKEKGIVVVFADPQHSTRESGVIAEEINGAVVLLDPLAPDVLGNLRDVAAAIARSSQGAPRGVAP